MPYMRLELPDMGICARIQLLDAEAPRTCQAVWDSLPIERPAFQARRSGKELFILTDPIPFTGSENIRWECNPGDVFYMHFPPEWEDRHADFSRHESGLYDIAFIYGRDALLRGPKGIVPGNLFGRITDGYEAFERACGSIWVSGTERIVLRQE